MLTIHSILVPVDFTAGSAAALRYALALRRGEGGVARGARIEVAHATDVAPSGSMSEEAGALLLRWERERVRSFAAEVAGPAESAIETAVLAGEARAAIPERAKGFDLVVIGAGGAPGDEPAAGGVTEAAVRRSIPPVLIAKRPALLEPDGSLRLREVVFATDFTRFSEAALGFAMGLAFACGARVTALHVAPDRRALEVDRALPSPLAEAVDRFYEEDLGWRRDELQRFLRDRLRCERPVAVREVVRAGRAAEEVAAHCREARADLLVVATHGRSGLKRALLGSVAEQALRLAPCPVLSVRPPEA